jgi:hypothetical protein
LKRWLAATRISRGWDVAHVVATFALVAAALPHIVTLVVRAPPETGRRRPVRNSSRPHAGAADHGSDVAPLLSAHLRIFSCSDSNPENRWSIPAIHA